MEVYIIGTVAIIIIILLFLFMFRAFMKQELRMNELIHVTNQKMNSDIVSLSQAMSKDLHQFQHDILSDLKGDLNNLNRLTNESLYGMSKEMQTGMNTNFEKTNLSFNEVSKQLVSINETQKNLKSISEDISALQNILSDKKTRGMFGEVELHSILKTAYGVDERFYQMQYTLSNNTIADAVLFGAKPLGKIVIDSKFPLENYIRMYDKDLSKEEQARARLQFGRDVKKHIDDIERKYIIKGETAEMAYMFIPAEAIFAEINGRFEDVVQYAYKAKVYIVSPTSLMAFITTLKAIYLSVEQNDKLDLIQNEYNNLGIEFERFSKRYESLNRSFIRVYKDFEDLSITIEKIVRRFEEIAAVQLEKDDQDE